MDIPPPPPPADLGNLRAIKVLGKGAMGTVLLAHDASADPSASFPFALKVVDKSSFPSKFDAERRARWEIRVLSILRSSPAAHTHAFLPALISCFEDHEFLAWSVPFCPGGDLNALRHHQTDRVFSPAVARFYLAEILTALRHLHALGIAYRDLKPENVLVQASGHVTLTDFDLSRSLSRPTVKSLISSQAEPLPAVDVRNKKKGGGIPLATKLKKAKSARVSPVGRTRRPDDDPVLAGERSNSFVGTEEYVSPEVVRGDGHEFAVDWWALGVLAYEMVYGTTPFKGKNRKETFRNVLYKDPEFVGKRSELTDLIQRLLEKDPTRRLGYLRGAHEIMEHPFFNGVRWDMLTDVLRPPYIPSVDDDFDSGRARATAGRAGFSVREYFDGLRAPPETASFPPSPSFSYPDDRRREVSFAEF